MPLPSVTFRSELDPVVRKELDQLDAELTGYLLEEHDDDGKHTRITADALTVEGPVTITGGPVTIDGVPVTGGGEGSAHAATHEPGGTDELLPAAWVNQSNIFAGDQTVDGDLFVTGTVTPITADQRDQINQLIGDPAGSRMLMSSSYVSGLSLRHDEAAAQGRIACGNYEAQTYQPLVIESQELQIKTGLTPPGLTEQVRVHPSGGVTVGDHSVDPGVGIVKAAGFIPGTSAHHVTHEPGGSDALANAVWTNQPNTFTSMNTFPALYERARTVPMGYWQVGPFSAANFAAGGGGTWTVGEPALIKNAYTLIGQTLCWSIYVSWFSGSNVIAGTVTSLILTIPGGFGSPGLIQGLVAYGLDGGGRADMDYSVSGTVVTIMKRTGAAFPPGTGPGIITTFLFEVS